MQIEALYNLYLNSAGVTTDTRTITAGSIFFALKGDKFNANQFAAEAFEKGAGCVVVDEISNPAWPQQYKERLIVVPHVLQALQQLAKHHRQQCTFPVLAITGSNGKTTTKELVAAVLSKKYVTSFTKGNLNNHIGVPLTLLAINKSQTQFAVIEMGANHIGEIAGYCEYAMPGYGLITNIGKAHLEGFGSLEGVARGKTELYRYIAAHGGKIFADADTLLQRAADAGFSAHDIITYGNPPARLSGTLLPSTGFVALSTLGVTIQTQLVGRYNFANIMSAVCIGHYFGVPVQHIKEAIESYVPSNNRSQKVMYGTNTVILDAYNANPSSMLEALNNFAQINAPCKMVVLGEMMELGSYAAAEHLKIKEAVDAMQLNHKIFVGQGFAFLKNQPGYLHFDTAADVKAWMRQQALQDCCILIKGSRKNELEKILKD